MTLTSEKFDQKFEPSGCDRSSDHSLNKPYMGK